MSPRALTFTSDVLALGPVEPVDALVLRLRTLPDLFVLDSGGARGTFSVLGLERLDLGPPPDDSSTLRRELARLTRAGGDEPPGPFAGGWLCALSYDRGIAGERRAWHASDPRDTPRVVGGLYVDFLVRDETTGAGWLVTSDVAGLARASIAERRERVLELLRRTVESAQDARADDTPVALGPLVRHVARDEHVRRVQLARERIAAGDFYQVNLAQRFTRRLRVDPLELYPRLRRLHPASYMVAARWRPETSSGARVAGRGALLSGSPELLLEFDGRTARTRPIKGTAARGTTPSEDAQRAAALLASAKDRAELAMIVDLERNDLGRVARAGGVRVARFAELESYASVHHLVADVVADIAPPHDAFDLLDALFPGGSITGAPKLASMAAIAELEGEGRGFFSGSAGFVDVRGRAEWNILIRTLVWRPDGSRRPDPRSLERVEDGELSFHVGGGVTWSSDPAAEELETRDKGRALARVLGSEIDSAQLADPPS